MKKLHLPVITSCTNPPCGACCEGQAALPISLLAPELTGMVPVTPLPPALVAELQTAKGFFMAHGFPPNDSPCIWYDRDKKQCKHYEHRPEICRDSVKVGDEACRRWRKAKRVDPVRVWRMVNGRLTSIIQQRKGD